MKITTLAFAALLPLAACAPAGGVSLSQQEVSIAYSPGEFAYAGAGRDLRVVIVGNPFGGDAARFHAAVTDAMQGRHWGQRTNFTTKPDANVRANYRVLMLFNPPATLNAMRLCRDNDATLPTAAVDGAIVLYGAFCRNGSSLTSIKGQIPDAASARDPAFRDLVGEVTSGLFPPDRGRGRDRNKCPPWTKC